MGKQKKESRLELLIKNWRRPTFPQTSAVSSAMRGLTSRCRQSRRLRHGMGRGVVCRRLGRLLWPASLMSVVCLPNSMRQPNSIATKNKKRAPQSRCSYKDGRRLTFPQTSAVSSARAGLTSLFGMGRGEHRLYNHPNKLFDIWHKTYKRKILPDCLIA